MAKAVDEADAVFVKKSEETSKKEAKNVKKTKNPLNPSEKKGRATRKKN